MDGLAVVQLPLLSCHLYIPDLLRLFRQVPEHILLQPPQDKGPHHSLEPLHGLLVIVFHHRDLKFPPEGIVAIQKARHQIIKNAPKLAEPVLNGRSRKGKPETAFDHLHRLRRRSGMILDVLGLIQDLIQKLPSLVKGRIPFQKIIGGDEHVRVNGFLQPFLTLCLGACRQRHL